MKDTPILMTGPLVVATLQDRKTQTRRCDAGLSVIKEGQTVEPGRLQRFGKYFGFIGQLPDNETVLVPCPYGGPGDRLWVRENFKVVDNRAVYQADEPRTHADKVDRAFGPWKPSIFMPRWACRLLLEIVSVRVERVQDISEADARAEGVEGGACCEKCQQPSLSYVRAFSELWDSINAKRGFGWDVNPWVWVIEYKRIKP